MAPKTERIMFLRALRQLHRVRTFYALGVLVWTVSAVWTGWYAPGSRQMWASIVLLLVFLSLLATAWLSLRRIKAPEAGRPAHHAASHRTANRRQAHALHT